MPMQGKATDIIMMSIKHYIGKSSENSKTRQVIVFDTQTVRI